MKPLGQRRRGRETVAESVSAAGQIVEVPLKVRGALWSRKMSSGVRASSSDRRSARDSSVTMSLLGRERPFGTNFAPASAIPAFAPQVDMQQTATSDKVAWLLYAQLRSFGPKCCDPEFCRSFRYRRARELWLTSGSRPKAAVGSGSGPARQLRRSPPRKRLRRGRLGRIRLRAEAETFAAGAPVRHVRRDRGR
jgi:hypothetical protein